MRPPVGTRVSIVGGKYQHHKGTVTAHLPVWVRVRLDPQSSSGTGLDRRTANWLVNLPSRQLMPILQESILQESNATPTMLPTINTTIVVSPSSVRNVNSDMAPICDQTSTENQSHSDFEIDLLARLATLRIARHLSGQTVALGQLLQLLHE